MEQAASCLLSTRVPIAFPLARWRHPPRATIPTHHAAGLLLLLLQLSSVAAQFISSAPPPPDPAVPALLVVRQELGAPSPYLDSWLRGGPCDNGGGMHNLPPYWTGITCYDGARVLRLKLRSCCALAAAKAVTPLDQTSAGVWGVNLSYYPVSRPLPPSISRIPTLYTVTFSQAGMVGTLPPVWADLPKLMYLDLSGNQLTGESGVCAHRVTVRAVHWEGDRASLRNTAASASMAPAAFT